MTVKLIAETRIRYKEVTYEPENSFLCDDQDAPDILNEGLARQYPKPEHTDSTKTIKEFRPKPITNKVTMYDNGIVFIAHHISSSEGYGCLGHELMKKYPTVVQQIRDDLGLGNSFAVGMEKVPLSSNVIQLCAGDLFKDLKRFKKSIGFTMFETNKLSKHWSGIINASCHELIVPAQEVKKVFKRSGVKIPIQVVPLWLHDIYRYYTRPKRKTCTFLWIGRLDHFNRKGAFDAISAFKKEFKTEQNVKLIIKGSNTALASEKSRELFNDHRIKLDSTIYSREGIYELFKNVDCFVFPTHGEGFGLPPLEAMATGLPTIVSAWMGCKEFAKKDVCYPIPVTKLEPAKYHKDYGDIGKWAAIDNKKLRKLMRYVYENPEKAKDKGLRGAKLVNRLYRFENFHDNLQVALKLKDSVKEKVSIIMAIKDNLGYLKDATKAVIKNTKVEYEFIIVDNGSGPGVKTYLTGLQNQYPEVKVITNEKNTGYAYACNQGIKLSRYDYICMLDADTVVAPLWLKKMLKKLNEHPECGIIVPSQQYLTDMYYVKFEENKDHDLQQNVDEFAETLKDGYAKLKLFNIYGFCHLVRRKVFEDIGVFDWKRYFKLAGNDTDLFWRAEIRGWKLGWAKGAFVYHHHNKIKASLGLDPTEMVKKGHAIFHKRALDPDDYFVKNDATIGV